MQSLDPAPSDSAEPLHGHPAFFQALQATLLSCKDMPAFKYAYPLTTKPLSIDTLIILKPQAAYPDKNIPRLFKAVNG
jgi:hypothetical protein